MWRLVLGRSVAPMKLVVQVRLLPSLDQAAALARTLRACNEAATWVSEVAFEKDAKNNFALRRLTYAEVRTTWGLGAQAAQHVVKKTCDAYAALRANLKAGNLGRPGSQRRRRVIEKPIVFRVDGAQPYDDRMLSWQIAGRRISIWTTAGRMKDVEFTASPEQLTTLARYRKGESDLVCRDGLWFLLATCEVPEAPPNTEPADFLGVDLGIVNIATTSDGEIMAGRELNRIRVRERKLRTTLQKKTTPSADRPGRPHGYPRAGTASKAPTGHPLQLGLCPAGAVHRVQGPPGGGAGGVRGSGVHLAGLCRVRAL